MKKKLIYVSISGFESQVLNPLKEVEKSKIFDTITLLVGEKDDAKYTDLLEKNQGTDIEIIRFKKYPNYHFYTGAQSTEFKRIFSNDLSDNSIIHIRGDFFALAIKKAVKKLKYNNVKIVSDVRGASYEETQIYGKSKFPFYQFKLYQQKKNRNLLRFNNDYISCVSQKLKEYVVGNSKMDPNKVFINHCIAGGQFNYSKEIRDTYRNKLGVNDTDVLFLFMTGGNSNWQNTDEVINSIADRGYKILNLSKKEIIHKNVINLFVPYREVHKYLNASDIGVIWRNDDVVNNVACPIKFSEYACCGLPIVANNGVDIINNYISKTGFGLTIKNFTDITDENVKKLISFDRNEINKYASSLFSLKVISDRYIAMYKEILN